MSGPNPTPARLRLAHITKRYPAVVANDGVSLTVAPGEIHAVLGENGAGKSTLMKIIYGAVQPDAGDDRCGTARRSRSATRAQARALGIAMVFQHFALFETLTVARERRGWGWTAASRGAGACDAHRAPSPQYGLPIDPRGLVHSAVGRRAAAGGDHPRAADRARSC